MALRCRHRQFSIQANVTRVARVKTAVPFAFDVAVVAECVECGFRFQSTRHHDAIGKEITRAEREQFVADRL